MNENEFAEIELYSDGGAEPNPGQGGFGVILSYQGTKKEFSQGFRLTTNNRMELMGVIHGLERLKRKSIVRVYSDSRYVIDGITKGWAEKWKSNKWYRIRTEKATNHDLWERLLIQISNHERVNFNWIKGHFGHPENERCDELANIALNGEHLMEDTVYEENLFNETGLEFNTFSANTIVKPNSQLRSDHVKVKAEGDPCRKCGTSVIFRPAKKKEFKPGQTYFFEYYFLCPKCKTVYLVEEAKRFL
ncbi:MAG: ribonuclease HI [Chitinophagaceae bacterium]